MADPPDLDARPVETQGLLEAALYRAVIALFLHVDEVDDDQAREVAQLELARDLVRCLEIGVQRRLLDGELARRLARVDVDGDQRLGLVDDQIAARLQVHIGAEHGIELPLDLVAGEQRLGVLIDDHVLDVARHQHAHEVAGFLVGGVARDDDLVDLLAVEIADGALDEVAFLVNERRRRGLQRQIAHVLP